MTPEQPATDTRVRASGPVSGDASGETALRDAAAALRDHVDARWVEVADRVVLKALSATRRSLPIRAADDGRGRIDVSEQVLVSGVRAAIADVPASLPTRIRVDADARGRYTGVTVEITVEYDHEVLPIADEIRDRTRSVLTELLGPVSPAVTVASMHVHVSDVTTANPKLG